MQGKGKTTGWIAWCLLAAALLLAAGCRRGPALPPDPGFEGDALGLGLRLGMEAGAARSTAGAARQPELLVLSREALLSRDPYAERTSGSDLVVVIVEQGEAGEEVAEIRAYLADPQASGIQLLEQTAAKLSPDSAAQAFGAPARQDTDEVGITHLLWDFAAAKRGQPSIEVTLSFGQDGSCFALALRRPRPQ